MLALLLSWGGMVLPQDIRAACPVEATRIGKEGPLVVHLPPDCTPAEREARAVGGAAIMETVAKGRAVDLVGVIVRGGLIFDDLAVQTARSAGATALEEQPGVSQPDVQERRLVREAVTIRDSVVSGAVRHRSAKGMLQFEGPVDLRGTIFKEGVDLSRTVFLGSVALSGATFEKEAYFIQSQFLQALACDGTKFGPHTRFQRSTFRGPVDCSGVLFDGLAELLEVNFEQSVTFERARFGLGTGFSGSRFKRRGMFEEAIFSRDAFFGFTVFEGEVSFAGSQFLGKADFSDAEFRKPDDLAKARFDQPPLLTRTKRVAESPPTELVNSPAVQYALTALCLIAAAMLVGYALRLK
ncbi:MAG: pentapeptide repeat-containing protein [Nitrospiraceae bacterium]